MQTAEMKTGFVIVKRWSDHPQSSWVLEKKLFSTLDDAVVYKQRLAELGWLFAKIFKVTPTGN